MSHALGQIEQICDRSIWINEGKIEDEGIPKIIHAAYIETLWKKSNNQEAVKKIEEDKKNKKRWGNKKATIKKVVMYNDNNEEATVFKTGSDIRIRVEYEAKEKINKAQFGFGVFRIDDAYAYGTNTGIDKKDEFSISEDGVLEIQWRNVNLIAGRYKLDLSIEEDDIVPVDFYRDVCRFDMYSDISDVGMFRIEHEWKY